jgi:putative spermidine/putrescine transport system permease protein
VNAPVSAPAVAIARPAEGVPLGQRWAVRGLDGSTLLVLPAALLVVALFVYPFPYGLWLSFQPKAGGTLANYQRFFSFSDEFFYGTIATTLWLALPVTLLNLLLAVPIAFRVPASCAASDSLPRFWWCRSRWEPCSLRRAC